MSAYAVFIRERIHDPKRLADYSNRAREARQEHVYSARAAYGETEALEGVAADGVLILEFASMAAARAWYASEAYQEAASIRKAAADFRVLLVEGAPPR